ncbi:MAG: hypothetical protein ABIH00_02775 [Armatimonadota bacterium]
MNKKILIALMVFVCITGSACFALDDYFFHDMDIRIVNNDNLDSLYGVEFFDRSSMILKIQCNSAMLTKGYMKLIDKFLERGGAVWITDSFVARNFGFEPANFTAKEVKGKAVKAIYGYEQKYPAYMCTAYPASTDSILTGVEPIKVGCIMVGPNIYSAIAPEPGNKDFYPLLKIDDVHYASAYITKGKGKMIFMPCIDPKNKKSKIFLDNVREFSYSDLNPEPEDMYACSIYFKGGKDLKGFILNREIGAFVNNDSKTYQYRDVNKIVFKHPREEDEIYLKTGEVIKGIITVETINFTPGGDLLEKFDPKDITEIIFGN